LATAERLHLGPLGERSLKEGCVAPQPSADNQQFRQHKPDQGGKIRRFWLWLWGLSDSPHELKLLEEYWQGLQTWLLQFEARATARNSEKNVYLNRLRELLSNEQPDWLRAFAADKLLPQLLDDNEVEINCMSRLEEAKTDWSSKAAKTLQEYNARWQQLLTDKAAPEMKRAFLQELTVESLWQFALLRQEREYRSATMNFSARMLVFSLVALILAFWSVDRQVLDLQSWLGNWWMVALAGWVGASFSWITSLRATIQEKDLNVLKELSRPIYSISRACIGVAAALALYLALRGGFISGAVFPVLDVTQSEDRLSKVVQAFSATVKSETSCAPVDNEKTRDALIASAAENFRAQLVVHVRTRNTADPSDREWLRAAGVQQSPGQNGTVTGAGVLTFCGDMPNARSISNALLLQQGTLALLLFWSFVAGFSEKLAPSLLDRAGEKAEK